MELKDIINGYESWIRQNSENGSEVYLVTFQFKHLSSNGQITLDAMKKEIERFYKTLLTSVVRRPRRVSQMIKLPQLIAIPDRPVFKRVSTYRLADILPNDGLHFHAIVTIPHKSRMQEDLVEHIQQNGKRFRGNQGKISKIDVRPVELNGRLVDYTFKHIKRETFTLDDILILPKSRSELEPKVRRAGR